MPWWYGDPEWPFPTSADLYFRIGWATTFEEIENDWGPAHPFKFKLFINDEEIPLQRYGAWANKSAGIAFIQFFYHVFGPGYFEVGGEYLLRFEFWVRRPYQGDGKNYWRIFVDYDGIFSPPGTEFVYEYYLNIVEDY
jgi:hypothetical protein